VRYLRINPLGRGFNLLVSFPSLENSNFFFCFLRSNYNFLLNCFANRAHVAPRLSHTNIQALNYLLRSKIFVHEDGQLRATHLILGYEPLSRVFLDVGQSIKAGSPRLARIDMSKPGFLAPRDLPPVALPVFQNPQPAAQPPPQDNPGAAAFVEEETESSRLSLEEEIDEFYFEEDIPKAPLIELSDTEGEPDRNFVIGAPLFVVACLDDSSDEEVDNMASNKGKILRELMAAWGKGQTSKAPTKSQIPSDLPPASPTDSCRSRPEG